MLLETEREAIAYAVWRDAGCGKWRPDPSDVVKVSQRDSIMWVVFRKGAWPVPVESFNRFLVEYQQKLHTDESKF